MLKLSFLVAAILTLGILANILAQEQVSITTYYPSPEGIYSQLRANRLVVHPSRPMPGADGTIAWGQYSNRGMLLPDQGSSIELGGTGTPYIDFANDNSTTAVNDFDARIMLVNNTLFLISILLA